MANVLKVRQNNQHIYDIIISQSLTDFPKHFEKLGYENRRICIVSDSNVASFHGQTLLDCLKDSCKEVYLYAFPAGEENKTLDVVRDLYAFLIENHFDRKDCLVALGGGVVGDLTGYTAATYLRGIDFIQVPTSLLAMVDSSIGGKTGVDFDAYKNMVGAFKMPKLVYMNLTFLDTLPEEQYFNGMGEIIKHGLIQDDDYFVFLLENMFEIVDREPAVVEKMITDSCKIKRNVVEEDPTEQGIRAWLNFGHTIGHSVEKLKDFTMLHGQCVSVGMVCAAYLSYKRGHLSKEEYLEIRDVLVAFCLPISVDGLTAENIVAMTKSDKKMDGNTIKFVLLKSVGEAFIDTTVTDEELIDALNETILKAEDEDAKTTLDNEMIKLSDIFADNPGNWND